jgi:DnaJ-domain-containing protein 1
MKMTDTNGPAGRDPRRLIVRLAVAVMTADGRITAEECEALERFDDLGLGPLCEIAEEEIERAASGPIDLRATCAGLAAAGPRAASVILAALADVAASDRKISPSELGVLEEVAALFGLPDAESHQVINLAAEARHAVAFATGTPGGSGDRSSRPRRRAAQTGQAEDDGATRGETSRPRDSDRVLADAYRLLGVDAEASDEHLDAAYLALVDRYNPSKVGDLGPEFAVMAVRKLAEITGAFETIREYRARSAGGRELPDTSA